MALVTYETTLTEWENIIRVKLKVANPALLKSGALGILANYLAGIKYDTLQFYTKALQESNVGLAQDFNSMLYHSTIFGTELEFAVPATLSSSIVVPEVSVAGTDLLIYTIPRHTPFVDTNGLDYIFISEIKMEFSATGLKATSWNPQNGTRKLTVTKAPNPNVPGAYVYLVHNSDAQQYKKEFWYYNIPEYNVGESFSSSIGIENIIELKELNAWVNNGESLTQEQKFALELMDPDDIEGAFSEDGVNLKRLNIRFYKFSSSARDQDIFFDIFETSISFETGDGIHGSILPAGSELIIDVETTKGEDGNVPNAEYLLTNVAMSGGDYFTTLNGLSTTGSYGGKNIEQISGIRENIFNQITIRNSVITENDYERLFKYQDIKPFVDAKFLDAKAFVFLFNVIHDNDQIVETMSFNFKEADLIKNPFYPIQNYAGFELVSPFYYKHDDINTVDAYIVNPQVVFTLSPSTDSPAQEALADYRVDLALTYEFQRTQNGMNGTSFIEILNDINEAYEYRIYCSWLGVGGYITLSTANDFKYEVNTMYTDPYCVIREKTEMIKVEVYDTVTNTSNNFTQNLLAKFEDNGSYHQLIKKQTFYKYYQELPDGETPDTTTNRDSVAYLDNYLNNLMATSTNIFELNLENNSESYLLRMPFINLDWFFGKDPSDVFEILDDYFIVEYIGDNINYNTQLTQSFHNTIDIPSKYYPYLFAENTMPITDTPMFSISVDIFASRDAFIISKYQTVGDLELAIKIAIIKYLKTQEGFMIDYFETDLEKLLYNEFSPLLQNVRVTSPTLFRVNNSAVIYNLIQDNLSFKDVLDFVPPYFFYDYNNINLTVKL
jgi:hypothetical protein